ncbi:MAG TPA: hypothetical protein VNS34_21185 [Rhizobiaceae bacterium]|nr:hypothetical protein [Rhizobiaceae bacterium]
MLTVNALVPLLVEIVCGAAGAVFLCWLVRRLSSGLTVNAIVGALGGLAFTWLAARIPGLGRFLGQIEQAADATAQSMGGLSPAILVGVGISGLVGGMLLATLVGLIRSGLVAE